MTVKRKISKEKRKNQKRNKMLKQGILKKKHKRTKFENKTLKSPQQTQIDDKKAEESDDEDMLNMIEEDDLNFLKNAITNRSYSFLNNVKLQKKSIKRPHENDEQLEQDYENHTEIEEPVKVRNLLPIKAKGKIIPQVAIDRTENENDLGSEDQTENDTEEEGDSFELQDEEDEKLAKPLSTAELLAAHAEMVNKKKIQISSLCASVLENPEEKIDSLRTVMKIFDEDITEAFLTVRKLVIVSLLEVFKDILPSFKIKHQDNTSVKLKKETLKLQKYEDTLLLYYRKFLQRLEKLAYKLIKKKGNTRKLAPEEQQLAELSLQTMCDLLVALPYFNFAENIVQAVVPFLNNHNKAVRAIVSNACKTVFKEDKRGEISLKLVRTVNQLLKKHIHNVNTEMLEIFLNLKIKDVNLDEEKEQELKQKKLLSHKKRVLQLSKKEKKRKKQLEQLEKELLETKAEENKKMKQQNLTEITKVVFGICFRILKSSKNTKMLGIALEILSKFAHCINLDFYVDLINILNNLMEEDWLSYRERLNCIKAVFSILSGQGEALTLDPSFLYISLYRDLLTIHCSKSHKDLQLVLETLTQALVKRRKKVTNRRQIGFAKRIGILSLQVLHNGSLACLAMIKRMLQQNHAIDVLLDLDPSLGDGSYQPEIEDPEYCSASTTALYEMTILNRHYHPAVRKYSVSLAHGVPTTGANSLPPDIVKCTPEELFAGFDMSEMAFNPPVPAPNKTAPKLRLKKHGFVDADFEEFCTKKSKFSKNCKGIFSI